MVKLKRSGEVIANQSDRMCGPAENARGMLKFSEAPKSYAAIFRLSLFGILPIVHTFGMKFSIDVVLCDSEKRIIFFEGAVRPNRLVVPWRNLFGGCRYLVEFSLANTSDLKLGDELSWEAA